MTGLVLWRRFATMSAWFERLFASVYDGLLKSNLAIKFRLHAQGCFVEFKCNINSHQ